MMLLFSSSSDILTSPLPNATVGIRSIDNARRLYDSCVNEAAIEASGTEALLSIVNNELGGWPILRGSSWNSSTFDLPRLLVKLREYSQSVIYSSGTSTDDKNSSAYFVQVRIARRHLPTTILSHQVSQSDLALEQRDYYARESNITVAYRLFIRDFTRALTNDASMIDNDVQDIYDFEAQIAKVSSMFTRAPHSTSRDFSSTGRRLNNAIDETKPFARLSVISTPNSMLQ